MAPSTFPCDTFFAEQDDQVFLLRFGKEEKFVSMTVDRLKRLSALLPALPYLLFGHPSGLLERKSLSRHEESGMLLVEFPSYMEDVTKKDFIFIMNVALGIRTFENCHKERLSEVVSFLGGSELVESMLAKEMGTPTSPPHDKYGRYRWLIQVVKEETRENYNSQFRALSADGWDFAGENGKGAYLLRKPKSQQEVDAEEEENATIT